MNQQAAAHIPIRRHFRFGLKGLMLLTLLLAIGAAWVAGECQNIRQRRDFVEQVTAAGGFVHYWTLSSNQQVYPQLRWHRKLLGDRAIAGLSYRQMPPEMHDQARALFPELVTLNGRLLKSP